MDSRIRFRVLKNELLLFTLKVVKIIGSDSIVTSLLRHSDSKHEKVQRWPLKRRADLEPKNKREEILSLTASHSKFMALSATGINPGAARHSALMHGKRCPQPNPGCTSTSN